MRVLLIFIFISCGVVHARVVVKNNMKKEIYETLDEAIEKSVSGDTIYIPKAKFSVGHREINKKLHWVGAGCSSFNEKKDTIIEGDLYFGGESDGSSFEEICFQDSLYFGDVIVGENGEVNQVTDVLMKQCRVRKKLGLIRVKTDKKPNISWRIIGCVFSTINTGDVRNCSLEGCVITGYNLWPEHFLTD